MILSFLECIWLWLFNLEILYEVSIVFAGTWALPSSVKDAKELKQVMKKPLSGEEAIESLNDIFGDDDLFDELGEVEEGQDARPVVINHLKGILERYEQEPDEFDFEKEALKICRGIAYKKNERNSPTNKLKRMKWKRVNLEKLATLLKEGADPNVTDSEEWTPLHYVALQNQTIEVASMLIKAGANVNASDDDDDDDGGTTPIHLAVESAPSLEFISFLLKEGADPIGKDKGVATLCSAAYNPNPDVIRYFLKMGIDVNAKENDSYRRAPLHCAAGGNSNPEVVAMLLEAGADVHTRDGDNATPLHRAASWNSNPEVVAMLLEAGADVNARDDDKKTPLHGAASWNSNPEVVAILLKAGADVHARNEIDFTPLHGAARWNSNPEVVAILLEAGADVNARDEIDFTPLHDVYHNDKGAGEEIRALLLKAGADPTAKNKHGEVPGE